MSYVLNFEPFHKDNHHHVSIVFTTAPPVKRQNTIVKEEEGNRNCGEGRAAGLVDISSK